MEKNPQPNYRGTRRELYEIGDDRRGRPRLNRVKLFVKLDGGAKQQLKTLSDRFPRLKASQSELVGIGVDLLGARLESMAAALGRSGAALPTGVVDLEALYLLWNLSYPSGDDLRSTTVYLSQEQALQLSEIRARLRLQIRVNQSELINLGASSLVDLAGRAPAGELVRAADELKALLDRFA